MPREASAAAAQKQRDDPAAAAAVRPETAQSAVMPPAAARNSVEAAGRAVPQSGHETEGVGSASAVTATVTERMPAHGNRVIPVPLESGIWSDRSNTQYWLTAYCSTVWTSNVGKYKLPFGFKFGTTGSYRWWAPLANGVGEEHGSGTYLSLLHTTLHDDGSWETSYFAANRFTPDATNATHCCCEYVGQAAGVGQPRVKADYCIATVSHSSHLPLEEVCVPHIRQCPLNNATALAKMGSPFIQIYSSCASLSEHPSSSRNPERILQHCLVLMVAVAAVVQLAGIVRKAMRVGLPQRHGLDEALL